jgi:RNA polymerase sigma factor (sigma-70 family)
VFSPVVEDQWMTVSVELYHRYGPALRRKCERMLHNPQDAEDVVQEVFAGVVHRNNENIELSYLYRAVTSRVINLIRDRSRRNSLLDRNFEVLRPLEPGLVDGVVSRQMLERLLVQLDRERAEILIYRYYDDLTQDEISTLTGLSRKTVGKRLAEIRLSLQALEGA